MRKNIKVLIIEHEQFYRKFIKTGLLKLGYKIIETSTRAMGIELYKKEKPDLVFADLELPGSCGLSLVRLLREISETTPIITLSDTKNVQTVMDALHAGASDHIQKPLRNIDIITDSTSRFIRKGRIQKQERLYIKHLEEEVERKTLENEIRNRQLTSIGSKIERLLALLTGSGSNSRNQTIGKHFLEELSEHLDISGGSFYLKDDNGLKRLHSIDPGHAPELIPFPLVENSPFSEVLRTGKSIIVDNIESHPEFRPSGWDGYSTPSFIIFPLPDYKGEIKGLLSLHNKTTPPFLSEDMEIGLLLSLIYKEVTRNMDSAAALELSENRLLQLTSNSSAIIFSYSLDTGSFDYINDSFTTITGHDKVQILNKNQSEIIKLLQIEAPDGIIPGMRQLASGYAAGSGFNFILTTKDGGSRWMYQKSIVISNAEGIPVTIDGIVYDYSEQKRLEEELADLGRQQNILLNEINHRVRNNMQIISSLINLQLDLEGDEKTKNSIRSTESRISTIAAVHDSIYSFDFIPEIAVPAYIEKLIGNLSNPRKYHPDVRININTDETTLDIDRAVLCGLIINEAVSNALNFAFNEIQDGQITVDFHRHADVYRLMIRDNGSGINLDSPKTKGLGLDIIRNLSFQLKGKLDIINSSGTIIIADFPVETVKRKELQ